MRRSKFTAFLLSVAIAFGLWLYVVSNVSVENEATFHDIPVQFEGETALEERELMITSGTDATIDLRLYGARTNLNKLNPSNITIKVDLSRIYDGGTHEVEYDIIYPGDVPSNAFITILLDDGTELEATLIAADKQTDLALLKVESDSPLPTIEIGSSGNLLVGQTAIAIGNPLGVEYANSVTVGIVSGLNRQVTGENGVSTMIQTDAAVNPGNSGGALVDASGKLIGVVSAKISSTDVEGIGFAIPIDDALTILNSLKEYGYVKGRPATGIASGTEITPYLARRYRLPEGLYVNEITPNSAAENAGLQPYDIILSVEGQEVTTLDQIEAIKKEHEVGDSLKITFYRSGKTYETTLTLTEDKG